jgi:hypothetical protein
MGKGRPERHDVDYFPFFVKRGKTLNILQSKYGLEGIGFFTNLMRFLAVTPDHHYCIKDEIDRMNFFSEIGIQDESRGLEMIELMVKTEKLDRELWEKHKVIVSQAFLESLDEAYKFRNNEIITISEIKGKFLNQQGKSLNLEGKSLNLPGNAHTGDFPSEIQEGNTQSKVNKSKVNKSKVNKSKVNSDVSHPAFSETPFSSKPEKAKKAPLREREPANDMERVEKAYLLNWDILYAQKKVKAINPVVNWNQTRKLLQTHFEDFDVELIIQAVNNALNDEWVLNKGYSLGIILSASVLNRLINGSGSGPPRHRIAADNVLHEKVSSYFREAK